MISGEMEMSGCRRAYKEVSLQRASCRYPVQSFEKRMRNVFLLAPHHHPSVIVICFKQIDYSYRLAYSYGSKELSVLYVRRL